MYKNQWILSIRKNQTSIRSKINYNQAILFYLTRNKPLLVSHTMNREEINKVIRNRRTVSPAMYIPNKEIPKEVIMELLENANWAPTHRMTEPWRFKVFTGDSLARLSEYLGAFYKNNTPAGKFSEMKHRKTLKKPLQCAAAIAKSNVPSGRISRIGRKGTLCGRILHGLL